MLDQWASKLEQRVPVEQRGLERRVPVERRVLVQHALELEQRLQPLPDHNTGYIQRRGKKTIIENKSNEFRKYNKIYQPGKLEFALVFQSVFSN